MATGIYTLYFIDARDEVSNFEFTADPNMTTACIEGRRRLAWHDGCAVEVWSDTAPLAKLERGSAASFMFEPRHFDACSRSGSECV